MSIEIYFIVVFIIWLILIVGQKEFGKNPTRNRIKKYRGSENYVKKSFINKIDTRKYVEGSEYFLTIWEVILSQPKRIKPKQALPSRKTDLINLGVEENVLVWFGHSSYFIQIEGKKILVDPVLCRKASPIPFIAKAFRGTDIYSYEDIPEIDYLIITHDHWDHLDYHTITKLRAKIKRVICGLGIGEHFEYWGYDKKKIYELDWNEKTNLDSGFVIYSIPARHFSGRSFFRNKTLWSSFILQTSFMKIFIGCDGGYDKSFSDTGKVFEEIDLAILENGQYHKNLKYVHSTPEEVIREMKDLRAKCLLPIHSCKFRLSYHEWDEPLKRISALSKENGFRLLTPMIGEKVLLKDYTQKFHEWWKDI